MSKYLSNSLGTARVNLKNKGIDSFTCRENPSFFSKFFFKYFLLFVFMFIHIFFKIHAESISQKGNYPSFCQLASEDDEVFSHFKSHPIYREILEHVSYEHGVDYLNLITKEYPELLMHFDCFRHNDSLGDPITYYYEYIGNFSPTTIRYVKVAGDLKKLFGDLSQMHIVEIGGGYGGQCKIIDELSGFASYTIIDLPECNALSKRYLNSMGVKNVDFIDNDQLSKISSSYDLVISNYSFSEIDESEQKKYLESVINLTPNGYMMMNFISHYFDLKSLSIEDMVRSLYKNGRKGKVEAEKPSTHSDNLLLTWYTKKNSAKTLPKQPLLISSDKQKGNAITYTFSGGRLGDNLLAYFHAKWLSYQSGLPLLYKPFPYSDIFSLHDFEQYEGKDFLFENIIEIHNPQEVTTLPSSSLFVCPYFPETRSEYDWIKFYHLPFFEVDWDDPTFKQEVERSLMPRQAIKTIELPQDCITVALHVRRSSEAKYYVNILPLKFVSDDFYISQLQRVAKIFDQDKLYVQIFTDDENPYDIVEKFRRALNDPRMTFAYQPGDLLQDFYSIPKFDCCILSQSNFSVISSKLGHYSLLISPVSAVMKNNQAVINGIDLIFKSPD